VRCGRSNLVRRQKKEFSFVEIRVAHTQLDQEEYQTVLAANATVLQNGKLFSISMLLRILTVNRTGTSGAIDRENIGENHDVPIRLQLCNTVVLGNYRNLCHCTRPVTTAERFFKFGNSYQRLPIPA